MSLVHSGVLTWVAVDVLEDEAPAVDAGAVVKGAEELADTVELDEGDKTGEVLACRFHGDGVVIT